MSKNIYENLSSKEAMETSVAKYFEWLGGEHFNALEAIIREADPAEEAEIWSRLAEYAALRKEQCKKQIKEEKKEQKKEERKEKREAKLEAKLEKLRK